MIKQGNHNCRVCGLYLEDPPWGYNGTLPNHEICPCCGVEFGYEDYTIASTQQYRKQWIANGAIWFDSQEKPATWNLLEQMENIPEPYR